MRTHILHRLLHTRNLSLLAFGVLCIAGSFLIGIRSAGDVQTFQTSEAQQANLLRTTPLTGDIDGNGAVDIRDAIAILETIAAKRDPTPAMLRNDPDNDQSLTVEDALLILRSLAQR